MTTKSGRALLLALAALFLLLGLGRAAVDFFTDLLWYREVGYGDVFWTRILAGVVVVAVATLVGAGVVLVNLWAVARTLGPVRVRRRFGNLEFAEQIPRKWVYGGITLVALLAGWWIATANFGGTGALRILAAARAPGWGLADPLFGRDVGFYIFVLPILVQIVQFFAVLLLWSAVLVAVGYVLVGGLRWKEGRPEIDAPARTHFVLFGAALLVLLATQFWLNRYALLIDGNGYEGALGYTDVQARIPAARALATLTLIAAGTLVYSALRRSWLPSAFAMAAVLATALLVGQLYPSLVQKFRVEPNQLAREAPFIAWNLDYTRKAYGLDGLHRIEYPYSGPVAASWDELRPALEDLPLWDPAPLETVLNQVQTLFRYYTFPSVDPDRYGPPGAEEPVLIGVREFDPEGIPESARTWQTLRLNPKYVRGLGMVVVPAGRTTPQGQPVLWTADIDPVQVDPAAPAALRVENPSVFFGELTDDYVVLNPVRDSAALGEPGIDSPEGVRLGSILRTLAFAWRFGDKNLLFSGAVDAESRFVFRRQIRERVREIAPFLLWSPEAESTYPVVLDGRIVWVLNGYAASAAFPLSQPTQIPGVGLVRYLRHSAKATVDAVTGEVVVYALDEADPYLEAYRRVFPGLVRPRAAMSAELARHLRYPALYLGVQADILEEYHLESPEAFYAGQDVWQLPPEVGPGGAARPYSPMYMHLRLPAPAQKEFVAAVPFIARARQNMTALLVARNDPPNFGELVLLDLPRDQQIPGPTQVETIMEQDPTISAQLSLWRQAGSDVDLGQIRIVPLDSTFLYVEPLFLSAQGSPIPELERVVVSDGRSVAMATTLAEAIQGLQGVTRASVAAPTEDPRIELPTLRPGEAWPRQALELLEEAERHLRQGEWGRFGQALEKLRRYLRDVAAQPDGGAP